MDETLEQIQARHRKEAKELQGRITNKKKNASKKNRKGINDECAELERQMKNRHEDELRTAAGGVDDEVPKSDDDESKLEDNDVDALAEKVAGSSLDGTLASPPPTQQTQEQEAGHGGGKKRNRQKERLARRAAEQEAAAVAAETEASTMVDHRGIERAYMNREFKAHGLREKDIEPDGHCLFSAVADQLVVNGVGLVLGQDGGQNGEKGEGEGDKGEAGGRGAYKVVRKTAADYMTMNRGDFEGFLEEPFEQYVEKIRDTAEWGGQLELSALARAYDVEIKVVQDGRTETIKPLREEGEGEELKTLWLAYYRHGYGLGEHYNSLRKVS